MRRPSNTVPGVRVPDGAPIVAGHGPGAAGPCPSFSTFSLPIPGFMPRLWPPRWERAPARTDGPAARDVGRFHVVTGRSRAVTSPQAHGRARHPETSSRWAWQGSFLKRRKAPPCPAASGSDIRRPRGPDAGGEVDHVLVPDVGRNAVDEDEVQLVEVDWVLPRRCRCHWSTRTTSALLGSISNIDARSRSDLPARWRSPPRRWSQGRACRQVRSVVASLHRAVAGHCCATRHVVTHLVTICQRGAGPYPPGRIASAACGFGMAPGGQPLISSWASITRIPLGPRT